MKPYRDEIRNIKKARRALKRYGLRGTYADMTLYRQLQKLKEIK